MPTFDSSGSSGDGYTRCPKCGLPYWAFPSDFASEQATCQCNTSYILPVPEQYPIPPLPHRGWICPKCGSVYSPDTAECIRCNGYRFIYTTTTWETNT